MSQCPLYPIEIAGKLDKDGRLVIKFGQWTAALSQQRSLAFLWIVAKRLSTETGYTHYSTIDPFKKTAHATISRLRDDLNQYLGVGAANRIFEGNRHSFYRLLIQRDAIIVRPSIGDLVPFYLPADLVAVLLANSPLQAS